MKKIKSVKNNLLFLIITFAVIALIYSCNETPDSINSNTITSITDQIEPPLPPVYVYVKQNGNCDNSSIAYVTCYDLTNGGKASAWTNEYGVATFGILVGHQWTASAVYNSHYGCTPYVITQNEGGSIGTLCLDDLQCKW